MKNPFGLFQSGSDLRSKLLHMILKIIRSNEIPNPNFQSDDVAVDILFFTFCHGPSTFLLGRQFYTNQAILKKCRSRVRCWLDIGSWSLFGHWSLDTLKIPQEFFEWKWFAEQITAHVNILSSIQIHCSVIIPIC